MSYGLGDQSDMQCSTTSMRKVDLSYNHPGRENALSEPTYASGDGLYSGGGGAYNN